MWSEAEFRAKARAYFDRAEQSDQDEAAEFLWCVLGLEFLLRAPLAKINPALLADATGHSILHACGLKATSDKEPLSITTKTVIERLKSVVEGFSGEVEDDAKKLVGFRNHEIHSSDSVALNLSKQVWLPKLMRVIDCISAFFEEQADDYFDNSFCAYARNLVDQEDNKILHAVRQKISKAKTVANGLTAEEKAARKAKKSLSGRGYYEVLCPACDSSTKAFYEVARFGAETLQDDWITSRVFLVASEFECPVCGLSLDGVREFDAAGLPQEQQEERMEALEDRYAESFIEPDYGND